MLSRELLEKVKEIDNVPLKLKKLHITPWSTDVEKTSEILRLEISSQQQENKQLLEDMKNLEKRVRYNFKLSYPFF